MAEELWFTEHVNLPCHPGLTDEQVDHLADALDAALGDARTVIEKAESLTTVPSIKETSHAAH
ncbi:hypothetical protein SHKM778_26090 [Streptomyces sp. KM77-8]|uniref:Uncharacterized protein n=1 Tax=Streptomyces haneummycinicus TaxID=3074435 RepID=A0AAT9HFG0_9ACTN